ncbi:ABC transporter ATP-binding protein [Shewanella intestini]|uniref:ABC transporter ATP-binding protein n=1 Tax=Shewanella intestini TaxID=2017544 RepID=A0ABS5I0H1_9GAMM|nr:MULTISPECIES: ABC transporter ATP-binding protein [Shewanella]MBR9727416.1 ABC transporter ATP-binding protein [Shewanella intestini]MRG35534.1 ATP-binding cassette domain-containing protein [Shewanella sp. XMDDZSB0408]
MFKLTNIRVNRGGRDILSIDDLSITSNGLTVVLGHNGSGKSTLVNLLSGQQSPDSGTVMLENQALSSLSPKKLAQQIAYLPQKLPDVAGFSVFELIKLGRFPWRGTFGRWQAQDQAIVEQCMAQTNVSQFADDIADTLSGGERQRAWVAMLLAQQSPVLILDEPTSALDIGHQYQLMALLSELNQQSGRGIIVILHDLNLALRYATDVVALSAGKVAFSGNVNLLNDEQRISELFKTEIALVDHPRREHSQSSKKIAVVC